MVYKWTLFLEEIQYTRAFPPKLLERADKRDPDIYCQLLPRAVRATTLQKQPWASTRPGRPRSMHAARRVMPDHLGYSSWFDTQPDASKGTCTFLGSLKSGSSLEPLRKLSAGCEKSACVHVSRLDGSGSFEMVNSLGPCVQSQRSPVQMDG